MKFFRVGSCLALLMAGVACTQAPQAITAPSASVGGSTAERSADGSTLKVTAPALVSPVDGVRAEDRRPTLIWLNSNGQVRRASASPTTSKSARPTAVVYSRTVGESPDIGAHLIDLELEYDMVYSWRVRAHVGNPDSVGPWSSWASFLSPTRPVATAPPAGGTAASTRRLRRADFAARSRRDPQAAAERLRHRPRRCQRSSRRRSATPARNTAASWEFMDRDDRCAARQGRPLRLQRQARQHERPVARRRELLLRQRRQHPEPPRGLHLRPHRRPLRRDTVAGLGRRDRHHQSAPAPSAAPCIRVRAATSAPARRTPPMTR